jgi:hypothetical protein
MIALKKLLRMNAGDNERASALELLTRTPVDQLDAAVQALKKRRPAEEVRAAMVEVIARAPLADFETLKRVYLKHCADPAQ